MAPRYDSHVNQFAPVLVTGFNRPDFLSEQIQLLLGMGCKVYVSLDVPKLDDLINLQQSQDCISVVENYSEKLIAVRVSSQNLGCYLGITEAITWGFKYEQSLIILEDDIRVDKAFLTYATNMLTEFESDKTVGSIAGSNFVPNSNIMQNFSRVRFSAFTSSWGWATWKDRLDDYLLDIETFPEFDFNFPENFWSWKSKQYWTKIFKDTKNGKYDAWDYRWLYSNWKHRRLTLTPDANLAINIGFGAGATHTQDPKLPWWLPRVIEENFQVATLPRYTQRDLRADKWMEQNHFRTNLVHQLRARFSSKFPKASKIYRRIVGRGE